MTAREQNIATGTKDQGGKVERLGERRVYIPRADIYETPETIVLLIDMPGVGEKGVDITLEKNTLTVDGTVDAQGVPDHSLTYSEYIPGGYHRAFTVSAEFDADKIHATVKNGTVRLVLPKAETVKAQTITVSVAD